MILPKTKVQQPLPNIYLIDDDHIYHSITEMLLERVSPPHSLVAFYNGHDALDLIQRNQDDQESLPNVILLDINMPVADGWDFLDGLKPLYQRLKIKPKICMMSSSSLEQDTNRAMNYHNVVGFITKPITIDHLDSLLNGQELPE